MFSEIRAQAWKFGTFASAAVGIAVAGTLGFMLLVERAETARLTTAHGSLYTAIHDPKTGYISRLAQCQTTGATLTAKIEDQNARIRRLGDDSARRLAAAETELTRSRAETSRLSARAAGTLAFEPPGADACARMDAVRRRYLEGLAQ